jgi:uncharacterized protein
MADDHSGDPKRRPAFLSAQNPVPSHKPSLRHWFRSLEPKVMGLMAGPFLSRLKPWLDRRDVLNFSRQPLALGVAIGMFCGLIPGPLQILTTAALCAWFRGNLVAGAAATFYTNPLTIVPLYALAYQVGAWVLPGHQHMPQMQSMGNGPWFDKLIEWVGALGWPLVVGLPVMGLAFALAAYAIVQAMWLAPVLRRARRMKRRAP